LLLRGLKLSKDSAVGAGDPKDAAASPRKFVWAKFGKNMDKFGSDLQRLHMQV